MKLARYVIFSDLQFLPHGDVFIVSYCDEDQLFSIMIPSIAWFKIWNAFLFVRCTGEYLAANQRVLKHNIEVVLNEHLKVIDTDVCDEKAKVSELFRNAYLNQN